MTARLAALALLALASVAGAQPAASAPAQVDLVGAWEGTSLCLQGKPVCKDEHVVYHIARAEPAADTAGRTPLRVAANKVVAGVEEEMGVLDCTYTRAERRLECPMPPQFRPGTWRFDLRADELVGGLWMTDGTQFREVRVRRRAREATPRRGE